MLYQVGALGNAFWAYCIDFYNEVLRNNFKGLFYLLYRSLGDSFDNAGNCYEIAEDWHQWFYNISGSVRGQVGGYATRYATTNNFTFITIRGGRHEVPETAPISSFEMLNRLLSGTSF